MVAPLVSRTPASDNARAAAARVAPVVTNPAGAGSGVPGPAARSRARQQSMHNVVPALPQPGQVGAQSRSANALSTTPMLRAASTVDQIRATNWGSVVRRRSAARD